jgi:hypothetical protein
MFKMQRRRYAHGWIWYLQEVRRVGKLHRVLGIRKILSVQVARFKTGQVVVVENEDADVALRPAIVFHSFEEAGLRAAWVLAGPARGCFESGLRESS